LAREPDGRFATAGEFAAVVTGAVPIDTVPAMVRPKRRLMAMLAFVALMVIGFLVTQALRRPGRHPITSLAILPLGESGPEASIQYLSEGIHEAVADLLRQLPQLRVTAPSLIMQLQRQRPTATSEELGRSLGVGAVLTWDLRRSQDSLHIRAELLEIPGGSLLWSSRYDRPFQDILTIQNDIARTISESLRLTLRGEDVARLARQPTRDAIAYDLYLKGTFYTTRASPFGGRLARESAESAFVYANRVITRDPNFGAGHFLLADAYLLSAFRGWRRPFRVAMDSSVLEQERAFALDSTFSRGWTNRGLIAFYLTDDWTAARRDFSTAVRLDPDLAYPRQYYGIYLGEIEGAFDSAIAHASHAARLEPAPFYLNTLGDLLMRARRYDSALTVLHAAVARDSRIPGPWNRIIQIYERTGRWKEAIEARRQAPDTSSAARFAASFERGGEAGYRRVLVQDVRGRIDSLVADLHGPPDDVADTVAPLREARIALLYAQVGEWSKAMDWVLQERARRPRQMAWILAHPDLAGLRNDPRFPTLTQQP
jgi:TolB-like protein